MTELPAEGRSQARAELAADPRRRADHPAAACEDKAEAPAVEGQRAGDAGKPTGAVERRSTPHWRRPRSLTAQLAEQRKLEALLWRDLWRTPQAVQWERLGWTRDVAQYVRHKVLAELGDLDSAKEARQWSDRLGLTPLAMLRLRWYVVADELAERRQERTPARRRRRRPPRLTRSRRCARCERLLRPVPGRGALADARPAGPRPDRGAGDPRPGRPSWPEPRSSTPRSAR
jgi:hypothetical protein